MKIFKLFMNYDKEERYLEEMARKGNRLTKKGLFYTFKKQAPQQMAVQIDYRQLKRKQDYQDYLSLFENAGWLHIAGTRSSGEQYFMKMSIDREEDLAIFSDRISSARRYLKKAFHSMIQACCMLLIIALFQYWDIVDFTGLWNPQEFFYTPGLWEKTGSAFRKSFLFELIFVVIFRFGPLFLLACNLILVAILAVWAFKVYRQEQESITY
ncbi:DUF2812 domain-containing protein [Paenibacillus nasutitermitis]|uniref:DUF2812 domain-containing protein n=1 Tax=Paenibacillus nasutitermitis TaxID=1652958 RepID=A0A916YSV9_9BACL|nr:DUF2812 domain-containing protein [Paenibacillus nasutitermitis]GGD60051.1 hypothetical protein GCM10010911_17410 [Paenibacillus nasutitermitis]